MTVPSPGRKLLLALDQHLNDAAVSRRPSDALNSARPPLWVEPSDGVPAPGDKLPPERDASTVLGLFRSGGIVGSRWERQINVDIWIRAKGNQAMLRIEDLDDGIRDAILGSEEFRTNFLLAPGTDKELRVIEAKLRSELTPIERSAQAYTDVVGYWFQTYGS